MAAVFNAGHNPPLWIRKDGSVTELAEAGLLFGFQDTATYPEGSIQLVPGDLLLLYTDGVTDSVNERDEMFGMTRLLDWARGQPGKPPAEVKESLIDTIREFCGKSRQADDLTVLVVQYREPSSGPTPPSEGDPPRRPPRTSTKQLYLKSSRHDDLRPDTARPVREDKGDDGGVGS